MSNDDLEKILAEFRDALKKSESGTVPYAFNAEEIQWFKRIMRLTSTDEQARHLRRAIIIAESLTDKQIAFLPALLDGGLFGTRLLRWGFWVLASAIIIGTNVGRILEWTGLRGPE